MKILGGLHYIDCLYCTVQLLFDFADCFISGPLQVCLCGAHSSFALWDPNEGLLWKTHCRLAHRKPIGAPKGITVVGPT